MHGTAWDRWIVRFFGLDCIVELGQDFKRAAELLQDLNRELEVLEESKK